MAKKAATRRRDEAGEKDGFAGTRYDNERVSATFDYNELCFARAAELLGPRLRSAVNVGQFVMLLALIFVAIMLGNAVPLLVTLFIVAVALLYVYQNWSKLQLRYARTTNLAQGGAQRRRVVVCDDAIHLEDAQGGTEDFDLSDLRHVHDSPDSILACFAGHRYVYVPRSALSENRFRDLARFLREKLG